MKDKLVKRHRPRIDWYNLRLELADSEVEYYYWLKFSSSGNKKMSLNRRSYYALLHVYGPKRLKAYRYSGVWSL